MVALQRPKFAQKSLFPKFSRCLWRRDRFWALDRYYTSNLTIYDIYCRSFDILEIFYKNDRFSDFFWNLDPQNSQKSLFIAFFAHLFRKMVALQRPISKLVVRHPSPQSASLPAIDSTEFNPYGKRSERSIGGGNSPKEEIKKNHLFILKSHLCYYFRNVLKMSLQRNSEASQFFANRKIYITRILPAIRDVDSGEGVTQNFRKW